MPVQYHVTPASRVPFLGYLTPGYRTSLKRGSGILLRLFLAIAGCYASISLTGATCAAQQIPNVYVVPSQTTPAGSILNGLTLSLTPQTLTARLGDPLWVTVELRNASGRKQAVFFTAKDGKITLWPNSNYEFTIVNRLNYQMVWQQPSAPQGRIVEPGIDHPLSPGSSMYARLQLDALYRFLAPGTYSVIVTSNVAIVDWHLIAPVSNPITITLLPSQPKVNGTAEPIVHPTFGLTLQTDRPVYVIGQPMFVRLTARNETSEKYLMAWMPPWAWCYLLLFDEEGNAVTPPGHGGGSILHYFSFPARTTRVLAYQDWDDAHILSQWADLAMWGFKFLGAHFESPGDYELVAFPNIGGYSTSNPVRIKLITEAAAKATPRVKLDDPGANSSISALLMQYLALRLKLVDNVKQITESPHVGTVFSDLAWPWFNRAQDFLEQINRLPGAGVPTSAYVLVDANLALAERHLSKALDTAFACDLVRSSDELRAGDYFYEVVRMEMSRGDVGPGDAANPPLINSAPGKCQW